MKSGPIGRGMGGRWFTSTQQAPSGFWGVTGVSCISIDVISLLPGYSTTYGTQEASRRLDEHPFSLFLTEPSATRERIYEYQPSQ